MTEIVLASQSAARRDMLANAGIPFVAQASAVDEDAVKESMVAGGADGRAIADALAELKAVKLSARLPGALVLGCDSTVVAADGRLLNKASDRDEARGQLRGLSGTTHRLFSAAVVAQNGVPIWRHVDVAHLTMRPFSDAFLETYLDREWPAIGACVGGYRLEGPGVQLFSRIDGSYFTILGLPLLPLLGWLRDRDILPK